MTATATGVRTFRSPFIEVAPNEATKDTAIGTLAADRSAAVTTITLDSAASQTIEVGDYLLIDSEVMVVTAVTSQTTFTVTRGQLGTAAAAHVDGDSVSLRELDAAGTYVDISPWVKSVSWPIVNEGGDATGAGTEYMETVPGEKPKEGPVTIQFMKSFTAGKVDLTLEPLARSGSHFWLKVRNDQEASSATNPEWEGQCHSLSGYMPVTGDVNRTDAATFDVTLEITSNMERTPAL